MRRALLVVGLWIPLFLVGMTLHEMFHAVAVLVLGSHPVLVLRPWQLGLVPLSITGVHVQPVPDLDPGRQALDNLLGPGVAAVLFSLAARQVRTGALRLALIATMLSLVFYAVIEVADVVLDGRLEIGLLTTPEFNYGVPMLLAVFVAIASRPVTRMQGR